jgi:hypothetical protein
MHRLIDLIRRWFAPRPVPVPVRVRPAAAPRRKQP